MLADRAGEDQPDRVVFGVLLDLGTVGAASSQLIAVPMSVRVRVGSSRQARPARSACPRALCSGDLPKGLQEPRAASAATTYGIIALHARVSRCSQVFIEVKIETSWLPR